MKRRVVVTGLGAVTPIGNTVEEFWAGIKTGKVGIGPIAKFDTTEYKVKLAAEVKDFSAKERMDFKSAKRMEPFAQYAVAAAKEAFADAGISCNAAMQGAQMRRCCALDSACETLMRQAFDTLGLTARSYDRILRVARTIADLDGSADIRVPHLAEAIRYRTFRFGGAGT